MVVAAILVLLAGVAAAVAWGLAERDREYRQLIAAGDSALVGGQIGPAIEAFSGALALKPDSMLAYLRRGEAYRRVGDLDAALRDLHQATALDPGAPRPLEQMGDVLRARGRFDRAAERYAAYVALDDRSPRVLYKLALSRYQNNQPAAAVAPLRRALALDDQVPEASYLLGLCLESDNRVKDAIRAYERAARLAPAMTEVREALTRAYRSAGRRDDAIDELEALSALEPARPERRLALARAYADVDRPEQAIATLGRAISRFPDSVETYATLGEIWLRVAEQTDDSVALAKALEALRTAVVRGGSTSRDLALYARAQARSGDQSGALRSVRDAAGKLPVDPETLRLLASLAAERGELREARDALVRYTALIAGVPVPPDVSRQIAQWSIELLDPATAATWLTRAIDPAHPDPVLLGQLAEAQLDTGRTDDARATLERALPLAPDSPQLRRLKSRLARP